MTATALREQLTASRDALDDAGNILDAAAQAKAAGDTLFRDPTNQIALADAIQAASKITTAWGRLIAAADEFGGTR